MLDRELERRNDHCNLCKDTTPTPPKRWGWFGSAGA